MRRRRSRGHGIIVGRRAPMIQLCPRCGQMRIHHPNAELYKCPVPISVISALAEYRTTFGYRWKASLRALWDSGKDTGALRQARNMIGPRRLYKIDLDRVPLSED